MADGLLLLIQTLDAQLLGLVNKACIADRLAGRQAGRRAQLCEFMQLGMTGQWQLFRAPAGSLVAAAE